MSAGKEMELISVELVFVYIPFFFLGMCSSCPGLLQAL